MFLFLFALAFFISILTPGGQANFGVALLLTAVIGFLFNLMYFAWFVADTMVG